MEGVVLPIAENVLTDAILEAQDYAMSHGIVIHSVKHGDARDIAIQSPLILFPSPAPRECFQLGQQVGKEFNLLMHKVAHDHDFLSQCLENIIKVDDFTRRLWEIYETTRKEGIAQPICLALNRSDYMFDSGRPSEADKKEPTEYQLKQIEFNTIAVGHGGLSTQASIYHRYILSYLGIEHKEENLPENKAVEGLAEGLVTAWQAYGNPNAVVMFVVYPIEPNTYDQRFLEYAIKDINPKIKVVRYSMQDIVARGNLNKDKKLTISGHEVAVVYFRSCYTPKDFPSDKEWASRLMLERSRAICCPTVSYQLAGTKKVQQELAKPGVVERYLNPQAAAQVHATFAGQYTLDIGPEGDATVALAMENPQEFVLKPQREGGGNNVFGEDIRTVLSKIGSTEERSAYILMDRIYPAPIQNFAVRVGNPPLLCDMVSEIGFFGILVGTGDNVMMNIQKGHLLRTKTLGTDEGGISTGFAYLDSPYLVD